MTATFDDLNVSWGKGDLGNDDALSHDPLSDGQGSWSGQIDDALIVDPWNLCDLGVIRALKDSQPRRAWGVEAVVEAVVRGVERRQHLHPFQPQVD